VELLRRNTVRRLSWFIESAGVDEIRGADIDVRRDANPARNEVLLASHSEEQTGVHEGTDLVVYYGVFNSNAARSGSIADTYTRAHANTGTGAHTNTRAAARSQLYRFGRL
jgi:hypothetical protein